MQNSAERDDGDLALRAGLIAAMLVGVVTTRQIIGVPAVAAADHETLIATIGPAVQTILIRGRAEAADEEREPA